VALPLPRSAQVLVHTMTIKFQTNRNERRLFLGSRASILLAGRCAHSHFPGNVFVGMTQVSGATLLSTPSTTLVKQWKKLTQNTTNSCLPLFLRPWTASLLSFLLRRVSKPSYAAGSSFFLFPFLFFFSLIPCLPTSDHGWRHLFSFQIRCMKAPVRCPFFVISLSCPESQSIACGLVCRPADCAYYPPVSEFFRGQIARLCLFYLVFPFPIFGFKADLACATGMACVVGHPGGFPPPSFSKNGAWPRRPPNPLGSENPPLQFPK